MKKRRWTAAAVAVMLLFTGCSFGTLKEQKTGEIEYEIVKKEEIPEKHDEEEVPVKQEEEPKSRRCGSVMQIRGMKADTFI